MPVEIERKFLVDTIPTQQINRSKKVKQGYIVNDEHQVVRVVNVPVEAIHRHILIEALCADQSANWKMWRSLM